MYFFTDLTTEISNYCLLNIKRYNDPRKEQKKICFIDPSVIELQDCDEFSRYTFLHQLANNQLLPNEYISIDYPADMIDRSLPIKDYLDKSQTFIKKSIENNIKYKDNLQYICTIQYEWMNYGDFEVRMKELEHIYAYKRKIVGLGNLCRLLVDRKNMNHGSQEYKYFKKVIDYIIRNREKFYWIHIYGMSLYAIKSFIPLLQSYAPNIILSVDSTKWTRVCNRRLHDKYVKASNQRQLMPTKHEIRGAGCTNATRNEFFLEYIKEIQKAHIKVLY